MGELIHKAWFRIATVMALLGFLVSLLFTLSGRMSWVTILIRPLLSALTMGLIGFLIYKLIQLFIPEFSAELDQLLEKDSPEKEESSYKNDDIGIEDLTDSSDSDDLTLSETPSKDEDFDDVVIDEEEIARKKKSMAQKAKSDEIVVEGVPLKKDPELMAQAVQHVLDKDKDT